MIRRAWLRIIIWLNRKGKSASIRLTKLTGKSQVRIHPKHLVNATGEPPWYVRYITPGMRVLDLGCGNGAHSIRAARQKVEVYGVDYNMGHLRTGQALAREATIDTVSFLMGDVQTSLPFSTDQFDLVLLLDVIEHLVERVSAMQEIGRVLHPDGLLLLAAPNRDTRWKRRLRAVDLPSFTDPDHKIEYTWPELVEELCQGGFRPVGEPSPIVYDTPWAGLIDLAGGISLNLYRRLARWKVETARHFPEETSGWRLVAKQLER